MYYDVKWVKVSAQKNLSILEEEQFKKGWQKWESQPPVYALLILGSKII